MDQRGREFIHVVGHLPPSPRKPRPSKSALTLFSKLHPLDEADVELDEDTVRLLTAFHAHSCLRHRFKNWRVADARRRTQMLRMRYALDERHHRVLKRRWCRFALMVSLRRAMVLGAAHCTRRRLRGACIRWFCNVRLIKCEMLRRSVLRSRLSTLARRSSRLCLTAWRAHLQRREVQALGRSRQFRRKLRARINALRAAINEWKVRFEQRLRLGVLAAKARRVVRDRSERRWFRKWQRVRCEQTRRTGIAARGERAFEIHRAETHRAGFEGWLKSVARQKSHSALAAKGNCTFTWRAQRHAWSMWVQCASSNRHRHRVNAAAAAQGSRRTETAVWVTWRAMALTERWRRLLDAKALMASRSRARRMQQRCLDRWLRLKSGTRRQRSLGYRSLCAFAHEIERKVVNSWREHAAAVHRKRVLGAKSATVDGNMLRLGVHFVLPRLPEDLEALRSD